MKLIDIPLRTQIQVRGQHDESLTDENDDSEWAGRLFDDVSGNCVVEYFSITGMITIGRPGQKFLVDFDSTNITF